MCDLIPRHTSISEIIDNLYISNRDAAEDEYLLRDLEITHILTVDIYPIQLETLHDSIKILFIKVNDTLNDDLLSHFDKTYEFIEDGRSKGRVIVHCFQGVSRSAAVVLAYLMRRDSLTYEVALEKCRSKRECVGPNMGFISQLRLYKRMNFTQDPDNIQYRLFKLEQLANTAKGLHAFSQIGDADRKLWLEREGRSSNVDVIKCKGCRSVLFGASAVLPHRRDDVMPWWHAQWEEEPNCTVNADWCMTSLFVEPWTWIIKQAHSLQGKLLCPKCHQKVGNYNWSGVYCECGACFQPAFHIVTSRVDLPPHLYQQYKDTQVSYVGSDESS